MRRKIGAGVAQQVFVGGAFQPREPQPQRNADAGLGSPAHKHRHNQASRIITGRRKGIEKMTNAAQA
jgi:hypothetical protein